MIWAVRGRDIEMKTILGTFFFLELQTHTHLRAHTQQWQWEEGVAEG